MEKSSHISPLNPPFEMGEIASPKKEEEFAKAIYLRFTPKNRQQKRAMFFEYKKVKPLIDEIEDHFIVDLFYNAHSDYNSIYTHYLDRFKKLIEKIVRDKNYRYTLPDVKYFVKMYGPVEKATS